MEGGGFVRKVVSTLISGNTVTVNTVKAGLDEVFDKFIIDTSFVFSPELISLGQVYIEDEVQINGQVYERTIKSSQIELTKGTSGDLSFTFPNMSFKIETPDKTGVLEIKIKEVKLTILAAVEKFYFDFDQLLDINFGLVYKLDVIQEIRDVSCVLKGGINNQWPDLKHEDLFPANIPLGVFGAPPLLFTFEFNLAAGIEGKFYASGGSTLISSSTNTITYLVGAEYSNGNWSEVWEKSVTNPASEVSFNPTGGLSGEVKLLFIKPKIKIILDKTVGGNIFVRGFIYGEAKYPPIQAGIGVGVDGGVGFDLYFVKKKVLAYKWVIAEWKWPFIWSYLNNTPEFGTTVNPPDKSFKQPTDMTLQWSCSDPDGDDIKYNVYLGKDPEQLSLVSENQNEMSCIIQGGNYGTRFYWLVEAVDSRGAISRSPIRTFTTIHETGNLTDIVGNTYKTVKIGNQWWMAENLKTNRYNDGTTIPLETGGSVFGKTNPFYCWYNNDQPTYGNTYGALYNWYAVNTGKLCPVGWHIPTEEEWNTLREYLVANGYNYDGTTSEDKLAKSLSTNINWAPSSVVGSIGSPDYPNMSNASGFSALPGGRRYYGGTFYSIGTIGYWWSISEYNADLRWALLIYLRNNDWFSVGVWTFKEYGASVRCLKN